MTDRSWGYVLVAVVWTAVWAITAIAAGSVAFELVAARTSVVYGAMAAILAGVLAGWAYTGLLGLMLRNATEGLKHLHPKTDD